MTLLLKLLRVATITHKTVMAIAATVVISASVYDYLKNQKDEK